MSYQARHRGTSRPRQVAKKVTKTAALTGVAAAVPVLGVPGSADAATVDTWERLAQCESSGNWSINTGNGYYGGLQFSPSTWREFGGTQYAERADLATKAEQIAIAEKVLEVQGWNAWPACSRKLGLGASDKEGDPGSPPTTSDQDTARDEASSRTSRSGQRTSTLPGRPAPRRPVAGATYTIQPGDTLSAIAAEHNVEGGWRALWKLNRSLVGNNPDLIFPNEKLRLS
jgi:nucleoid-associated protein YgaU